MDDEETLSILQELIPNLAERLCERLSLEDMQVIADQRGSKLLLACAEAASAETKWQLIELVSRPESARQGETGEGLIGCLLCAAIQMASLV